MKFKYNQRQLKFFWYWINERHAIYRRRMDESPWPWTKDWILKEFKFTNVFRQLDRVTQEWTARYVRLLGLKKRMPDEDIFFHLCIFRFFNWPATYDALYYALPNWNLKKAIEILRKRREEDYEQIFTGAYIVTGAGKEQPKHETICEALDFVYKNRREFLKRIRKAGTMQGAVEILFEIPTVGLFVAYELACDMSHTKLLNDARDRRSWANAGPGAKRGIHRLMTGHRKWKKGKKPDYLEVMRDLYARALKGAVGKHVREEKNAPFEMREIEHSLCEFDKYMRVKNKEGKPRSRYWHREPIEATDDEE